MPSAGPGSRVGGERLEEEPMKAVAFTPREKGSLRIVEMDAPKASAGMVGVAPIRVGVCGTDQDILSGKYGESPKGSSFLVLGHESIGEVETVGTGVSGFSVGDLVVAMVRRPDDCPNCRAGEPDMCIKGDYKERGIKGLHGYLCEHYVEAPEYLVKLPPALREAGVLLEPLTVVAKGIRHAWSIQKRMKVWEPRKALVLGAGPVGQLATLLLRQRGLETTVVARHPSEDTASRMEAIGAEFIAELEKSGEQSVHLKDLPKMRGPFDFVFEATGAASVAMGAMRIIGTNGVVCLSSVTGGESEMEICPSCLNLELVLGNRTVFGTVNANRVDFEDGVRSLSEANKRWPGWLEGMISRHVPLDHFQDAYDDRKPGEIKLVIDL
ncbi:glucose 1-dehydrogenase [Vulgatibacter incomptus]|uniref:Glucose 1-dehydrogenase n=1 Tax=Vulgatibacter incomptus TaxID=1391653 RepID=A0A0K1PHG1_9BACT|nr:glucose 1-dehydrogenase [Vulgatibacter incomptus]AKU92836.1 Glucose 1-dehydrogenase [Vulgatibacter incomptus]